MIAVDYLGVHRFSRKVPRNSGLTHPKQTMVLPYDKKYRDHRGHITIMFVGMDMVTACHCNHMAVCQDLVPLVNIKIAGKWMFIPLKMVCIGIDP